MSMNETPEVDYEAMDEDEEEPNQQQQQQQQQLFGSAGNGSDDDDDDSASSNDHSARQPPDDDENSSQGSQSLSSAGSGEAAGANAEESPVLGSVFEKRAGLGRSRKADAVEPIHDSDRDTLMAEVSMLKQKLNETERKLASTPAIVAASHAAWEKGRARARRDKTPDARAPLDDVNHSDGNTEAEVVAEAQEEEAMRTSLPSSGSAAVSQPPRVARGWPPAQLAARLSLTAAAASSSMESGPSSAPSYIQAVTSQQVEHAASAMTFRFHQSIQNLQKIEDLNPDYIAKFCAKLLLHGQDSKTTHQLLELGLYFSDEVRDILEIGIGQKMATDTVLQALVAKHNGNCQVWTWDTNELRDVQQALCALYPPSSQSGAAKGVPVNQEAYLKQITTAPLRNVSLRDRNSFSTWQDRIFAIRSSANNSGHGNGIDIQITKLIVTKINKIFEDDTHRPDDTNFVVDLARAVHQKYELLKPRQPGQADAYYPTFIQLMTLLGACWNAEWATVDRLVRKGLQLQAPVPSAKIPKHSPADYRTHKERGRDRSASDHDAHQQFKKAKGEADRCVVCGRKVANHENGVCPYTAHPDRGSKAEPYLSTSRAKVALEKFGLSVLPENWHCESGLALRPEQVRIGGQTKVANLTPLSEAAIPRRAADNRRDSATSVTSGSSFKKTVIIAQPGRPALKGGRGAGSSGYNRYKPSASQGPPR
jgi:hypothetical protein